jgi:hypothetical protein
MQKQTKKLLIGVALVSLAVLGTITAQTTPRNLVPIFDARLNFKPSKATQAETQILSQGAFQSAKRYWSKQEMGCDKISQSAKFEIRDAIAGAFTKKNAKQRAVLYSVCYGMMPGTNFFGLGILEKGKLIANITVPGSDRIGTMPDLNQNGISEILLASDGMMGGFLERSISFIEISHRRILSFGDLHVLSVCLGYNETSDGRVIEALRVYAQKGNPVQFLTEKYSEASGCEGSSNGIVKRIQSLTKVALAPDENYTFLKF